MKMTTIAAAAVLGLAGCTAPTGNDPASPDTTPVADSRFDSAVSYTCEGGGKLDVVFNYQDGSALARIDGGTAVSLPLDQTAMTTWKLETTTLQLDGGGATWTSDGAAKTCMFEERALPPPQAEGVARTLTIADAGASVTIKVGEKVAVALSGVPTAGYVWAASAPPAWTKASDGPGGATSSAQFLPGFAGGSHWEVVIIEAVAAGEGEIVLAQRRPWEDAAEPDASTFKFNLKAS
jgi:predicted secreted protein